MGHTASPNSVWEGPTQGHEYQEAGIIEGHLGGWLPCYSSVSLPFTILRVKVQIPSCCLDHLFQPLPGVPPTSPWLLVCRSSRASNCDCSLLRWYWPSESSSADWVTSSSAPDLQIFFKKQPCSSSKHWLRPSLHQALALAAGKTVVNKIQSLPPKSSLWFSFLGLFQQAHATPCEQGVTCLLHTWSQRNLFSFSQSSSGTDNK